MPRPLLFFVIIAATMISVAAEAKSAFIDLEDEPSPSVQSTSRPASPVSSDTIRPSTHGADFVIDTGKVRLKIQMTEKAETELSSGSNGQSPGATGYYVIVASARLDGTVGTRTLEAVAACTGLRPHLGLTQPGQGSFQMPAHAAYFGPYATREQAYGRQIAVKECVPDAYIGSGVIERY